MRSAINSASSLAGAHRIHTPKGRGLSTLPINPCLLHFPCAYHPSDATSQVTPCSCMLTSIVDDAKKDAPCDMASLLHQGMLQWVGCELFDVDVQLATVNISRLESGLVCKVGGMTDMALGGASGGEEQGAAGSGRY